MDALTNWPTARSRNGSMRQIGDTAPASRLIIDDLLTLRKTTPQP
jgi:hypothetical protein